MNPSSSPSDQRSAYPGVRLADLTWPQAEQRLTRHTLVVLPIGAAAKEHGPHLTLNVDQIQADYLAERIMQSADVVVLPTLTYHYYPAFAEYPGSTSLRLETARDLTVDVCRSIAAQGPRRFYALNTGISTLEPLEQSARLLAADGILLRFTDMRQLEAGANTPQPQQPRGTHADEVETSKLLYMAPHKVDMTKAVDDVNPPNGPGGLTRNPGGPGVYSPTGVWGSPTFASADKGSAWTESIVEGILREILALRAALND